MEKEFIPYEIALALKEIDYDEPCFVYYKASNENKPAYPNHGITQNSLCSNGITAPTFSQAFKWFRKKYGLHPHIFSREDGAFIWCVRWYVDGLQKDIPYDSSNTYEEAELKCLKKLIEIIKQK